MTTAGLIGDPFVIEWEDGSFTTASEHDIGERYDMADMNAMDGIAHVYARANGRLQEVLPGESRRINQDQDYPFYYATVELVTEDGTTAGHFTSTDH